MVLSKKCNKKLHTSFTKASDQSFSCPKPITSNEELLEYLSVECLLSECCQPHEAHEVLSQPSGGIEGLKQDRPSGIVPRSYHLVFCAWILSCGQSLLCLECNKEQEDNLLSSLVKNDIGRTLVDWKWNFGGKFQRSRMWFNLTSIQSQNLL